MRDLYRIPQRYAPSEVFVRTGMSATSVAPPGVFDTYCGPPITIRLKQRKRDHATATVAAAIAARGTVSISPASPIATTGKRGVKNRCPNDHVPSQKATSEYDAMIPTDIAQTAVRNRRCSGRLRNSRTSPTTASAATG